MIANEIKQLYNNYSEAFKWRDFLLDKLIFDDFAKLTNNKIDAIILGEAPWKNEYEQEKPFIWKAWENLRNNLNTDNIWITNTIKFRPVFRIENWELSLAKNRTPNSEEIKIGSDYFRKELELLQTYVCTDKILVLGATWVWAVNSILKSYTNIGYSYTIYDNNETEINNPFDLKWTKLEKLVNKYYKIKICSDDWKIEYSWLLYITYHPSPFNYLNEQKRTKIQEWIQEFQWIIAEEK